MEQLHHAFDSINRKGIVHITDARPAIENGLLSNRVWKHVFGDRINDRSVATHLHFPIPLHRWRHHSWQYQTVM